jgi:hypothetical protein
MKYSSLLDLDDAALVTHYVDIIQKHPGIFFFHVAFLFQGKQNKD